MLSRFVKYEALLCLRLTLYKWPQQGVWRSCWGNQPILTIRAEWWQLSGWVSVFSRTEFSKVSHLLELREQNHHELTLTTLADRYAGQMWSLVGFNLTVIMQKDVISPRRGGQNWIQTGHCKHSLSFFGTAFGQNQSLSVTGSEEVGRGSETVASSGKPPVWRRDVINRSHCESTHLCFSAP